VEGDQDADGPGRDAGGHSNRNHHFFLARRAFEWSQRAAINPSTLTLSHDSRLAVLTE
jgi:hypothetical protein